MRLGRYNIMCEWRQLFMYVLCCPEFYDLSNVIKHGLGEEEYATGDEFTNE